MRLSAVQDEYDGGRLKQRYDFVPQFLTDEETLPERAERPSIFVFSNYLALNSTVAVPQ